ncbi:hypothetical protein BGX27_003215 [Mortierella sp. AM989]|nr:hypothetical protein BGX27_003215 [Mortierella sp. AM989]
MSIETHSEDHVQANKGRLSYSLRTISFSHYNEKARWALDYYGIPYIEYRSLPILHAFSMLKYRTKAFRRPGAMTPFSTPCLTGTTAIEGSSDKERITLNDSTDILGYLSEQFSAPPNAGKSASTSAPPNLYSDDAATKEKIQALAKRFDTMIGPHVRRYFYYELMFHSPSSVGRSIGQHNNAGKLQMWLWALFFPVFSFILVRIVHATHKSGPRSRDILRREFEHISRVLESGPPGPAYLVGNQFSAADLTLACLGAVVVGITQEDGYGAYVPPISQLRPEAQAFCQEMRETTAGKHILECYKLHRGQKAPGSSNGSSFFGLW